MSREESAQHYERIVQLAADAYRVGALSYDEHAAVLVALGALRVYLGAESTALALAGMLAPLEAIARGAAPMVGVRDGVRIVERKLRELGPGVGNELFTLADALAAVAARTILIDGSYRESST